MTAAFYENLTRKIGENKVNIIREIKIGIAGAGGLGSNCAANLVRVGFKRLKIIDFDVVEVTNLDRQFYFADQVGMYKVEALRQNLLRINPAVQIEIAVKKIEQSMAPVLFADCLVVAECLDSAESKSMLVAELLPLDKLIVAVSGLGGYGLSDNIKVHLVKENLIMIGDLQSDVTLRPALSPRVNIAAAKQADTILEYVCRCT
ncbi:MAG: sulfur carrier protein ThiS adenylyltransferase ThiF [Smithella sp.]